MAQFYHNLSKNPDMEAALDPQTVRTDLANRPTELMLVSYDTWYTKLLGNCGSLWSGSGQTTPIYVSVICGSGRSVIQVG